MTFLQKLNQILANYLLAMYAKKFVRDLDTAGAFTEEQQATIDAALSEPFTP